MKMTKNQERISKLVGCTNSELKDLTKALIWAEKTLGLELTKENAKAVKTFGKSNYFKGAKAVKEGWNLEERKEQIEAYDEKMAPIYEKVAEHRFIEYWNRKVN